MLTEENKVDAYPAATLEGDLAISTDAVFIEKNYYDIKSACIVSKSEATGWTANVPNNNGNPPYNNNPNSNTTANSEKIYKLNADNNKTGLGMTLKVMAGDKISIFGKSYWFNNSGSYNQKFPLPVTAILDAFVGNPAIVGKGLTTSGISTPSLLGDLQTFSTRTDSVIAPWAYINWIFFDEQFKYVGGGFDRVKNGGGEKPHALIDLPSLTAPKNGYVFVYCSNESQHNVYFDNLQVFHNRGPILEETHYYPFGLTMAGISSKALKFGQPENKYKFNKGSELQSREFSDGSGLELYATNFRSLDPQLGRWWQIDPKPTYEESLYASMGNNPILKNDPLGDTTYYYSNSGQLLGRIYTKQTAAVILNKDTDKYVRKRLGNGSITNKNMNEMVAKFAKFGTTYDLKSFSKYYDNNINSVQAKTIGDRPISGNSLKVDGKTVQSLRAEVVSSLVIGNGVITTGSAKPATSEDVTHADPAKTNMEKNISGTHIHLHPYYKSVISLQDRFGFVDIRIGSGPSIDDYRTSPSAYSYSTERNVVVDSRAIYLINSNSDQTITLPKNIQ